MADGLRSRDTVKAAEETDILGRKATGGLDADADHIGNVEGGLKAAINNPNTSAQGSKKAEEKLETLQGSANVPDTTARDPSEITGRSAKRGETILERVVEKDTAM